MSILFQPDQLSRWRLVLGKDSQDALSGMGGCPLSADQMEMDEALAAIYDETEDQESKGARQAGLGSSSPRLTSRKTLSP
jgi:hypothetical protein